MKYTYNKFKRKENSNGNDVEYTTKKAVIESKTFDEILNGVYHNKKNIIKDVNAYYEYKKQKSLESLRKKYLELLNKKITEDSGLTKGFTLQDKIKALEDFEEANLVILDDSLLDYKEDLRLTKKIQRVSINSEVRDTEDSIADLAKWNSLLTSAIFSIYGTLSDTAKGKIPADKKAIMETIYVLFANTDTVADYKLKTTGLTFVKEMLAKESKIKTIVTGE